MQKLKLAAALASLTALTACNDDSLPTPPSITMSGSTVSELSGVTVTPTITSESEITDISWRVTEGNTAITSVTGNSALFKAPAVTQDETDVVTVEVTATDIHGQSTTESASFTVESVSPIISATSLTIEEKDSGTISASIDPQGQSIANVSWKQIDGIDLDYSVVSDSEIEITAPETTQDEQATFEITVSDADGDTVTATAQVLISQITMPVTFSGIATDSPISNAQITVQINGKDVGVTATADANGLYTIEVAFDDSTADSLITLTAQGVDTQANAGLISVLGTVTDLVETAGDDGVLDESDSNAVKITNISTAEYALALLKNDGQPFTSTEEYFETLDQVDYQEVLTVATAIKVAIDKSAGDDSLSLPDGTETTLELAQSAEALTQYVTYVNNTDEFKEAQEEILQDPKLVDETEWELESTYYYQPAPLWTQGVVELANDGTFEFGIASGNYNFDGSTLTLNWIIDSREVYNPDSGVNESYSCDCIQTYSIKRLSNNDIGETWRVNITSSSKYHDDLPHLVDSETASSEMWKVVPESLTPAINVTDFATTMLPFTRTLGTALIPYTYYGTSGDIFTFNTDGTGYLQYSETDFTWNYAGKDLQIQVGEYDLTIRTADTTGDHYSAELVNGDHREIWTSDGVISNQQLQFTEETAVGVYFYDQSTFQNGPLNYWWLEVFADKTSRQVSAYDSNEDGEITIDEVFIRNTTWDVVEGKFQMTYNDYGYLDVRQWDLGEVKGNLYRVTQNRFFPDFDGYDSVDVREIIRTDSAPLDVDNL